MSLRSAGLVSFLIAIVGLAAGGVSAQTTPVQPVAMGERLPAAVFDTFNPQAGGPATVDLGQVVGKKPMLLYYWIAGNSRADSVFQRLQSMVEELGTDRLALYGVAIERPGRDAAVIRKQLSDLEITVPVLDDASFRLGQQLRVQSVPNITLLDGEGRLRLTNGASLSQVLGFEITVESAIRRLAREGSLVTYGYLPRYYPVKELVGKKCPDFKAPLLSSSVEQRWSTMLHDDKVNVLIFWSVDCPHCRKSLPEINAWLKSNGTGVNVISAAGISNDESKTKTREFCELNEFVFPTLVDKDLEISQLYQVTTTPTILIIRPDGVVDSALTSGHQDFGKTMNEKRRALLEAS